MKTTNKNITIETARELLKAKGMKYPATDNFLDVSIVSIFSLPNISNC